MLKERFQAVMFMPQTHEEWPRVVLDSVPHRPELNVLRIGVASDGQEVIGGDGKQSRAPDWDEQKRLLNHLEDSLSRRFQGQEREARSLFPKPRLYAREIGADVPDVPIEVCGRWLQDLPQMASPSEPPWRWVHQETRWKVSSGC
jgi:hypothetical protein